MSKITGEETAGYPHASDVTNWTPDDRPGEDEPRKTTDEETAR